MKSILDAAISAKTRVFLRCDLDVPVENGEPAETFRLSSSLPTLIHILDKGGIPIIAGHMGRPDGVRDEALSTKHLESFFNERLGRGNYEILENLRFDSREEQNSEEFARELVEKTDAEIYVNEAFGNSHREHASMIALAKLLPAYGGIRLMKEIENLSKLIQNPERPFIAVVGGGKLETKKPAVKKLLNVADEVLVGGKIGLDWDEEVPANLYLPTDYVDESDIGPETLGKFADVIESARTIVWAGPVGKYEEAKYIVGTQLLAEEINESGAFTVIGGGDLIAALDSLKMLDIADFVSVGGGAMLEFLEKDGKLPALEVLG